MRNEGILFLSYIYKKHGNSSPPDSFGEMDEDTASLATGMEHEK